MKEHFPPDSHSQWLHWAFSFGWRMQPSSYDDCSEANVNDTQKYVFTFNPYGSTAAKHRIDNDAIGISGYTANQITELYTVYLKKRNITTKTEIISRTFDAVWASLMALENTKKLLPPGVELTDFDYKNSKITQVLQDSLRSLDFYGMSGRVSFQKSGNRLSEIAIFQRQGIEDVEVGVYNSFDNELEWFKSPIFLGEDTHNSLSYKINHIYTIDSIKQRKYIHKLLRMY
ncbi:DgyrCDS8674 [Dimorphilus gyrociliatus]|uniref:DgyrCDS8674 n=1 Tax=Dimorphilus gyrociliatus TaxID=2664684 RepID=A0A7I8VX72_9ANNE|nr:DgyrCDS8674 [Dimorphilus gyrociliatus]